MIFVSEGSVGWLTQQNSVKPTISEEFHIIPVRGFLLHSFTQTSIYKCTLAIQSKLHQPEETLAYNSRVNGKTREASSLDLVIKSKKASCRIGCC